MYKSHKPLTLASVFSEPVVKVRQLLKGSVILTDGTNNHLCNGRRFGTVPIFIMMNQLGSNLPICALLPDSSTTESPCYMDIHKHLFKRNN